MSVVTIRYSIKALQAFALCALLSITHQAVAALAPDQVPQFQIRFRVADFAGSKPNKMKFTLRGDKAFVAKSLDGEWSDSVEFGTPQVQQALMEYPNLYSKEFPVVVKLVLDNVKPTTTVEAEVRLAGTDEAVPLHEELAGPTFGLVLWRDASNRPHVGTMADYNRLVIWGSEPKPVAVAQAVPRHIPIIDRFIGGSDDVIEWREGIAHLMQHGANTFLLSAPGPMTSLLRQDAVTRVSGAVYSPPGYAFEFPYGKKAEGNGAVTSDKTPEQLLDDWAGKLAKPYTNGGHGLDDVVLYNMADEPGWYYPNALTALRADSAGIARFHRYLQTHHLRPEDLGATSWANVLPIGISEATDQAKRKLYYWTMQFFPWDSANYFAASTRAMDRAFHVGMPNPVNWNFFSGRSYVPGPVANNPDKLSPDAAMGGHDWFEFAQLHGSNMLWTEDWFSDNEAYNWSFYAAKLGPAARSAGISWGSYVVPRSSGETPYGLMQKVLSVVGNGGKAIEYFVFGPEYNFPGNCYSQHAAAILPKMTQVHGMIAKAEALLWPGQKPQAEVAILQPRSSEVWDPIGVSDATNTNLNRFTVGYMAEVYDLYRGLQQQNIPADFVAEDALTRKALRGYKVLFVTEPNFPQELVFELLQWVRSGGTLVSTSGAFTADRYNDPMPIFQRARGIVEAERLRLALLDARYLPIVGQVDGDWNVYGIKGQIRESRGTRLASFADGSPGIVENKFGQGAFVHFAFLPGISAFASRDAKSGLYPATGLKWIAYPVHRAHAEGPVSVDHLNVETPILESKDGAVMTMLNWNAEKLPVLHIKVRVPFTVKAVESVTIGAIQFSQYKDEVSFSESLDGADLVMLKR